MRGNAVKDFGSMARESSVTHCVPSSRTLNLTPVLRRENKITNKIKMKTATPILESFNAAFFDF